MFRHVLTQIFTSKKKEGIVRFEFFFTKFKHILTCLNVFEHVSTSLNLSEHVWTCWNLFENVKNLLLLEKLRIDIFLVQDPDLDEVRLGEVRWG